MTFPLVEGILALTDGAESDQVLTTTRVGSLKASPLASGEPQGFMYPAGAMQFTVLMGDRRGLYFAEEDDRVNRKRFDWTPDAERGTLTFTISHPVLNWGAKELVSGYESPGDLVTGPFQGDWFDAARIYRKWALTAPWCRKGTIHERQDYPRWLAELGYWSSHPLKHEGDIDTAFETQEFFGLPVTICKDYRNGMGAYFHDNNPEYLPPRLGSEAYAQLVKDLQAKGIRVVPYVIGYLWNTATESYRMEDAERLGGILLEQGIVPVTWAGSHDLSAGMCPATTIWRKKLLDLSKELVGKYGCDGIYFDYFTNHTEDCFNTDHGHPIAGATFVRNIRPNGTDPVSLDDDGLTGPGGILPVQQVGTREDDATHERLSSCTQSGGNRTDCANLASVSLQTTGFAPVFICSVEPKLLRRRSTNSTWLRGGESM